MLLRVAARRPTAAVAAAARCRVPVRGLAKKKKVGASKAGMLKHQKEKDKVAREEEREHNNAMQRAMKPFMGYKPLMPSMVAYMDLEPVKDTRTDEEKAEYREIVKEYSREANREHNAFVKQYNAMIRSKARAIDAIPDGPLKEHALELDMSEVPDLPVVTMTPPDPAVPPQIRLIKEVHNYYLREHELAKVGTLEPVKPAGAEDGKKKKKKKQKQ